MNLPVGTIINVFSVMAGSLVGVLLHRNIPVRVKSTVFDAIGLFTIFLGVSMAAKTENVIYLVLSLLIGALLGEAVRLETLFERAAGKIKTRVGGGDRFTEGLITAFLIFCIGPLTIMGSIEDGLRGDPTLLITKSVLDGFASIALASSFGVGVLFSAIPLFIYQGAITLFAAASQNFFTPQMIGELTAVGGVLILGLGVNLLELKRIKVANLLPALVVVVALVLFGGRPS